LVAFPTETVYGLGAHALDRAAVLRIFEAKGRPSNDPLIVHVSSLDQAARLVTVMPPLARRLAARFWPGPLTLVLARASMVPDEVTAGLDTVGIRIPAHPVARALIDAAGVPLAAPSANLFSRPSPTTAAHVLQDLEGRIDAVLDAGPTMVGVESTVLDLSQDVPTVLRPGAVTLEMLQAVEPHVVRRSRSTADDPQSPRSPGLLSRHYSPRAPLVLYEGNPAAVLERLSRDAVEAHSHGTRVGIVAADDDRIDASAAEIVRVGSPSDLNAVASQLYGALRDLDAVNVGLILVRGFPDEAGLGAAIQDRLRRAAGRIVRC
jgi:L-threonylcarbamoyladenylate synthase